MSNRICEKCKSTKVVEIGSYCGSTYYSCKNCHDWGEKDQFPEQTLFDRITSSPDVLAPKFIYEATTCDGDGYILPGYKSTITAGFWRAESEAIAATVAKLKEVGE